MSETQKPEHREMKPEDYIEVLKRTFPEVPEGTPKDSPLYYGCCHYSKDGRGYAGFMDSSECATLGGAFQGGVPYCN